MSGWLPSLDPKSPIAIYEQIVEAVAIAVTTGALRPGDRLPSVRTLASRLRLNPNTTARALRALEREGLAHAERGIGMLVSEEAARLAPRRARNTLERELRTTVEVARRLAMPYAELEHALRQLWEDPGHVD